MEKKNEKEKKKSKDREVSNCCYVADPCGCYMMDPCGCMNMNPCCYCC